MPAMMVAMVPFAGLRHRSRDEQCHCTDEQRHPWFLESNAA